MVFKYLLSIAIDAVLIVIFAAAVRYWFGFDIRAHDEKVAILFGLLATANVLRVYLLGEPHQRAARRRQYTELCRFLWPYHGFATREHHIGGHLVRVELFPVAKNSDVDGKETISYGKTNGQAAADEQTMRLLHRHSQNCAA